MSVNREWKILNGGFRYETRACIDPIAEAVSTRRRGDAPTKASAVVGSTLYTRR